MAAPAGIKDSLFGLLPDARAEDIEFVLGDVRRTLSCLDCKRAKLQGEIAAASRGKRCAPRRAALPPAAPLGVAPAPAADDPGASYTREGAGAVRRKLRAAAGGVKKERERLEAGWGDLEQALVDAGQGEARPAPGGTNCVDPARRN